MEPSDPNDFPSMFPSGRVAVITVFPWVASRANMLYLAASTHNRAAVYVYINV